MDWFPPLPCMYDFISKYNIYLLCQEEAYSDALTKSEVRHVHIHPLFPIMQCSNIWTSSLGGFWLLQSLCLQPHLYCENALTWKIHSLRWERATFSSPVLWAAHSLPFALGEIWIYPSADTVCYPDSSVSSYNSRFFPPCHYTFDLGILNIMKKTRTSRVCTNYVAFPRNCKAQLESYEPLWESLESPLSHLNSHLPWTGFELI